MLRRIKLNYLNYVQTHKRIFYSISLCFCVGLALGVIMSGFLSGVRQDEIEDFVNTFCHNSYAENISSNSTFIYSVGCGLKVFVALWLCSISCIFIPVALFIVAAQGFGIGFTIGSLSVIFGFRGFVLALSSILPGGIILVPVIIHFACCSVYYTLEKRRRPHLVGDRRVMTKFCITAVMCCGLLIISSLIDGYISPVFVKSISSLF
ncbi:MAG: stage II sporulation protein M [Eubacteriales bacterium]|nr:stage II sporulation protein M [Eubacteriales bacterium]